MIVAAVLGAIAFAFAVLLAFKWITGYRFCVLCVSVGATWLVLLVLGWTGVFHDPVLSALLMGQSVVGLYYLAEKKVSESLLVFTLPFVLTLTLLAYVLASQERDVAAAAAVVGVAWAVGVAVYASRNASLLKGFARQLIDCCRNW